MGTLGKQAFRACAIRGAPRCARWPLCQQPARRASAHPADQTRDRFTRRPAKLAHHGPHRRAQGLRSSSRLSEWRPEEDKNIQEDEADEIPSAFKDAIRALRMALLHSFVRLYRETTHGVRMEALH
jgi:hypothetical protein